MTIREATVVGLMSGTSTDGVDAAVVHVISTPRTSVSLLSFVSVPYEPHIRALLLALAENQGTPDDVARANFLLGKLFADAARRAIDAADLSDAPPIEAIGCSGHTIVHHPPRSFSPGTGYTMQIGEAAVIAEELGIRVVSDFRVRDVAAGGQGAPLVPFFDYCIFRSRDVNRAVLNIGGIANVTVLHRHTSLDHVVAFDTGPGNMPIDIATSLATDGRLSFDRDGQIAASGRVDEALLETLLQHEYFSRPLPKSCGREEFGQAFVEGARRVAPHISPEDLIATLTELTARTAGEAIRSLKRYYSGPWELIVSGGGANNPVLVASLSRHAQMPVRRSDELGVPSEAKEAMAFAFLAWATLHARPSNIPQVTGAVGYRILGKITPP